jgi:sterol desaturase/sphingolipid hydroxylase (fatty acid hydroxylase superfamily)
VIDLTAAATPGYFATMGLEHAWLRAHADERGPTPADYERRDTAASLAMGVGSLLAPLAAQWLVRKVAPGRGRHARALVAVAVGAAAVTTGADVVVRRSRRDARRARTAARAARVASAASVVAVAAGGTAITTAWSTRFNASRLWDRRLVRDLGRGPAVLAAAVVGWDFIYYWNHRFMHESRYMWAIHVVHHSSERYNLSTALRQPVADVFGTFVPYGLLCLFGISPDLVARAREINLLYQYWIHTDTIRRLGPFERVLNTPSHHRVHHGSNAQYIDRNHGSIFIVWDKLFGTFEPERDPVVYGLTKNLDTFNWGRVAAHEHAEMLRDVARSDTWSDRLSFVVRGPGWAYQRHREAGDGRAETVSAA